MKVLLDTCVWGGVLTEVQAAGHDVIWSGEWDEDPGDEEILAHAHSQERVLITLDKDFGEMAVVRGLPHHGIVRLVDFPARQRRRVWTGRSWNPGRCAHARRWARSGVSSQ